MTPLKGTGSFGPDPAAVQGPQSRAGVGAHPPRAPLAIHGKGRWGERTPMPRGSPSPATTLAKAWTRLLTALWSQRTGTFILLCREGWGSAAACQAWWLRAEAQHRDHDWCQAGTLPLWAGGGLHPLCPEHPRSTTAAVVPSCWSTSGTRRISEMGLSLVAGADTPRQLQQVLMLTPTMVGTLGHVLRCAWWPQCPPGFLGRPWHQRPPTGLAKARVLWCSALQRSRTVAGLGCSQGHLCVGRAPFIKSVASTGAKHLLSGEAEPW